MKSENTIKDSVNEILLNTIGISYDEYEQLDFDEQQKIMAEYHKRHPSKSKTTTVMIGGGDDSLFFKTSKGKKILTFCSKKSLTSLGGGGCHNYHLLSIQ